MSQLLAVNSYYNINICLQSIYSLLHSVFIKTLHIILSGWDMLIHIYVKDKWREAEGRGK